MPSHSELLHRWKPMCYFDSDDLFPPTSPAALCALGGRSRLLRGSRTLATASTNSTPFPLSLSALSGSSYPDGTAVRPIDSVAISGPLRPQNLWGSIKSEPALAPVIYGRVVAPDPVGDDPVWVQYWMCYFYNNTIGGAHYGDWEMVQYRVGPGGILEAGYAAHQWGHRLSVEHISMETGGEGTQPRPRVFVGSRSHASYPAAGEWGGFIRNAFHIDQCDGRVRRDLDLEILPVGAAGWWDWPGRWGGNGNSPKGLASRWCWQSPGDFPSNWKHWRGDSGPLAALAEASELSDFVVTRLQGRLSIRSTSVAVRKRLPARSAICVFRAPGAPVTDAVRREWGLGAGATVDIPIGAIGVTLEVGTTIDVRLYSGNGDRGRVRHYRVNATGALEEIED